MSWSSSSPSSSSSTSTVGKFSGILLAVLVVVGSAIAAPVPLGAQPGAPEAARHVTVDPALFDTLEYRQLDFSRGGRSTAVTGVRGQPLVYYFGSTGGGVWKTVDAGQSWNPVSDAAFEAGSIGAIAVADSDVNVIYVGTGSACPRGNVSPGIGMYRSTDAGKTWRHAGLPEAGQIGKIRVHPTNHDLVYVAVLGNLFGRSAPRGVFRSKDGGESWEHVLAVSDQTGAVDLSMDPSNPRVLYAGMWAARRTPWSIDSGSMDGGIYKTTDGGDTWTRLEGGLPTDVMVGKTAVAVSPANPERVWALIEAADDQGGVYRSDDAGDTWERVNGERKLLQRAWYYIHIYADPNDPDTVYALNTALFKSTDGGRTYDQIAVPHGDNHDLWINPDDPAVMINANDGGANVSFTGGIAWTTQANQPTAEIYRVTVDSQFPYRVYGAQQDNSTASVASWGPGNFYSVGGGESGHIAVDPRDPDIVFAGSYGGTITRMNVRTRIRENIRAYPDSQTGQRAADMTYRFQWNAPIRISPHDPDVVYHTSQVVHRTRDGGHRWEVISPDLTRNDGTKQDYSGGRGITRDNTGVEVYGTIFAFEESPHAAGLLWAGSDDGRVHLSRDGGGAWTEITPPGMPEFGVVNVIDLSAHDAGRAHVAVYRYRQDDFAPYVFQTNDYGATWARLTDGANGLPADQFVRVVREDPARRGLLYAGTEFGLYVSFDDGANWQPLQLNLPVTPVTDLAVHQGNLVVATQGRAFWVLDDLAVLRQLEPGAAVEGPRLFAPADAYRSGAGPASVLLYLDEAPDSEVEVTIDILDEAGQVVRSYTGRAEDEDEGGEAADDDPDAVTLSAGLNKVSWNARYASLFEIPEGIVMWGRSQGAPRVVPGRYQVRATVGDWSDTQSFEVRGDPRLETTQAEYREQLELARAVGLRIADLYAELHRLREVKSQATDIGERLERAGHGDDVAAAAAALSERLTAIEGELTQLEGEGGQDALNFPGRLDNQFVALYNSVAEADRRPSAGTRERFADIQPGLAELLEQVEVTLTTELPRFNELVRSKGVPAIILRRDADARR